MNVSASAASPARCASAQRRARAGRARRAMVAVGDVERRNGAERARPARDVWSPRGAPDRVPHAVGGGEVVERRAGRRPARQRRSIAGAARYVRNTTPVCARSSTMCRVRSSSLSRRVRSCFLMTSRSYSSTEKQPAMPSARARPSAAGRSRAPAFVDARAARGRAAARNSRAPP